MKHRFTVRNRALAVVIRLSRGPSQRSPKRLPRPPTRRVPRRLGPRREAPAATRTWRDSGRTPRLPLSNVRLSLPERNTSPTPTPQPSNRRPLNPAIATAALRPPKPTWLSLTTRRGSSGARRSLPRGVPRWWSILPTGECRPSRRKRGKRPPSAARRSAAPHQSAQLELTGALHPLANRGAAHGSRPLQQ